jgi:hypothetical protein
MHPKSVTLFIETDADDLPAQEQHKQRRARSARRSRSARAVRVLPHRRGAARHAPDPRHGWRRHQGLN